jgi:hypothetical protein
MSAIECSHEIEIVDTITSGRWPAGCTDELQLHAASCPVCKDVVRVALALTQDRSDALQAVRIPSAGLVWWRSEMRARRDAVNKATRPLQIVECVAALCVIVAAAALFRWFGPAVLTDLLLQPSTLLLVGLGVLVLLSTLVFYFVFSRD